MKGDAERATAMAALDRLVSWAVEFKRQPLTDDLTVHQAGVIYFCAEMESIGLGELARLLGSAPSTVTAIATRLENRGQLRRIPDPADGRKVRLTVTKEGRRQRDEIERRSRDYTRRLFAGWTLDELRTFGRLLERFLEAAGKVRFRHKGLEAAPASAGRAAPKR
jgi:DNA-binding MarR family transcriptional regulator